MPLRERIPGLFEGLALLLLVSALIGLQALVGGTRVVFGLPAYLAVGAAAVLGIFTLRSAKPSPSHLSVSAMALFLLYLIGRALLSPVPFITRIDLLSAFATWLIYLLVAFVLTSPRQRMILVGCLLAFGLAHVGVGALQFRDGSNFMPISWLSRYDYGTRASGFYVCPNHLAGLLEAVGVIGLSMVAWSRWPIWAKLLLAWVVGCSYVGMIITGSRGGYLSAGAGLVVFAVLSLLVLRRAESHLFWKVSAVGLVAALFVAGLIIFAVAKNDYLSSRAQAVVDPGNIRLELWRAALQQWRLQPFTGTGSATYLYFGRLFRSPAMQHDPVYVHNDYLQLLSEYGVLGGLLMLAALFFHLRNGAQSFARLGPRRVAGSPRILSNALALNIGALAALSAYLVHSALDFNLHIPANALLMGAILGLLANDGVLRAARTPEAPGGQDLWWRRTLPVLGLFLMAVSARFFPGEYYSEVARAAVRDVRPAQAILNAQRGLHYDPQNPELHHRLGLARTQFGEFMHDPRAAASFHDEAIADFEQARAIAPQEEIYALDLASALDARERFAEAEWIYHQAMRLDPRSQSIRTYYEAHLQRWRGPEEQPAPAPEDKS